MCVTYGVDGHVERQPGCPQNRPPRYLTLVFGEQTILWAGSLLLSKCVGRSLSSSSLHI
jgi:hypothetical protein